jgi:hypothetical protein
VDGDGNITPTEFVVCFVFGALDMNITRREKERGRAKEREGRREKRWKEGREVRALFKHYLNKSKMTDGEL